MPVEVDGKGVEPGSPLLQAVGQLDIAGIACCVWKGSDHLGQSMDGERDLDLLVDAPDSGPVRSILAAAGLFPTRPVGHRRHSHVIDHLGFNSGTGQIVQLQAYERLVIDDGLVPTWEVPFAGEVLASRRPDPATGVPVANPAMEVVLLTLGAAARITRLSRSALTVPDRLAPRVERLRSVTSDQEIIGVAGRWISDAARPLFEDGLRLGFNRSRLRQLRSLATARLPAPPKPGHRSAELLRRGLRRATHVTRERRHRRGRVVEGGGLLVAVVGSDGSGKSSVARDLGATFERKLDVLSLYFGSGDGPSSFRRWPLKLARRMLRRLAAGSSAAPDRPVTLARVLWGLTLASEKRSKLRRAVRARDAGAIVICDRFPQERIVGFNDGPLLHGWATAGPARRFVARWERRPYALAGRNPPDLVLHLAVDEAVASQRRPDHSRQDLASRIRAVALLTFAGSRFGVVVLDANAPYELVLRAAQHEVASRLLRVRGGHRDRSPGGEPAT